MGANQGMKAYTRLQTHSLSLSALNIKQGLCLLKYAKSSMMISATPPPHHRHSVVVRTGSWQQVTYTVYID